MLCCRNRIALCLEPDDNLGGSFMSLNQEFSLKHINSSDIPTIFSKVRSTKISEFVQLLIWKIIAI